MKKATINISDVKYFADEHELHIFGEINVDHVVLDFGLTQSVLGSKLRAEYEDVCLCYEVGMPPEFYYDENGKNAANIDEKVKERGEKFIRGIYLDILDAADDAIMDNTQFLTERFAYVEAGFGGKLPLKFEEDKQNDDGSNEGAAVVHGCGVIKYIIRDGKIDELFFPYTEDKEDLRDYETEADTVEDICDAIMQHVESVKVAQ
jgi:hypothetical protein